MIFQNVLIKEFVDSAFYESSGKFKDALFKNLFRFAIYLNL